MKVLIASTAALAAAAAFALPAAAQTTGPAGPSSDWSPSFYGTLGYNWSSAEHDGPNTGSVTGRLGARFGRYLGAEVEASGGVDSDHTDGIKTQPQHQYAGYAVGYLPLTPNADLFARVGYGASRYRVSDDDTGVIAKTTGESFNYGAGGQYFFDGKNGVRADYTRYDGQSDLPSSDNWSLSYVRRF